MIERIALVTREQCEELLSYFTPEEVRQLWEDDAFTTPLNEEVLEYLVHRIVDDEATH